MCTNDVLPSARRTRERAGATWAGGPRVEHRGQSTHPPTSKVGRVDSLRTNFHAFLHKVYSVNNETPYFMLTPKEHAGTFSFSSKILIGSCEVGRSTCVRTGVRVCAEVDVRVYFFFCFWLSSLICTLRRFDLAGCRGLPSFFIFFFLLAGWASRRCALWFVAGVGVRGEWYMSCLLVCLLLGSTSDAWWAEVVD